MKKLITILFLSLIIFSCGKKSSSDSENTVTTTPAISVDDNEENTSGNQQFSATANKSQYDIDELVLLEVKNLGQSVLNHQEFAFSADTEELIISRINCTAPLNSGEHCSFIIKFKNAQAGYHKLKIHYQQMQLVLTLELKGTSLPPVDFLYHNLHTYADCYASVKLGKNGYVKYQNGENFCSYRGLNWDQPERAKIESDPLSAMKDPNINASDFYCPAGWTLQSFELDITIVEEHTNFWGGRKDVTIPAGESREICVSRNLFGCKEKKVFYSRLMKVNCY